MLNAGASGRLHRALSRGQIDAAELCRLRRAGMRDANQLHEGIGRRDLRGIGFAIQSIAGNCLATGWKLLLRARPDQRPDFMAPCQQLSDQRTADVSGAAGNKDAMGLRIHRLPPSRHHTQAKVRWIFPKSLAVSHFAIALPKMSNWARPDRRGRLSPRGLWHLRQHEASTRPYLVHCRVPRPPEFKDCGASLGPVSCIEAERAMKDTLGVLLAGGAGERLYPLTRDRAKPAVTFGGIYRIIDVTLSNCVNSDLRRVYILTQYKALSLNRHIREGWNIMGSEMGEFIEVLPPMKRVSDQWYQGTADAVYQNIYSIGSEQPKHVLILSGDHIYKMNYGLMLERHNDSGADVTLATIQIDPGEVARFGVVDVDRDHRVLGFEEKPKTTKLRSPSNPDKVCASMGIYLFNTDVLIPVLLKDAEDPASSHDFGKDILPKMADDYRVYTYDFVDENKKEALYWRDVGTLEAYYEANMDIVAVSPVFNLYDSDWPIRTHQRQYPPAKFVFAEAGRTGTAVDSIVSAGCIVSGSMVKGSVVSPDVRVNSYSEVESSILFSHVNVGRHCRIRKAIIDRDVHIPGRHHHRIRQRGRPPALFRHRKRNHGRDSRLFPVRESSHGGLLHQRITT